MAKRTLGPPSLGQRIGLLLGRMALISEGTTGNLDSVHGGDDNVEPPGAWRDEPSLEDEWRGIFTRLLDLGELELERARRPEVRFASKEHRDERLLEVWPRLYGYNARFVAYAEDCSEDYIQKLWRRHGVVPSG